MKKILAVFLTGVICAASLCLTACGIPGEVSQGNSASDITEAGSGAEVSDGTADNSQSNLTEAADFSIGRMEGRTYINEFFDFYCALDNNWDIMSEEELLALYYSTASSIPGATQGVGAITWDDASIKSALENSELDIPVMTANGKATTLSVMIKKTGLSSEKEYEDFLNEYATGLEVQYALSGMQGAEAKLSTVSFKGEEHDCIDSKIVLSGQTLYQKIVFVHKDGYCATIMAMCTSGYEDAETFFTWFGDAEDAVIIEEAQEVQYEVDYLIGTVEEHIYTNEALGFRFEGGENCQYATVEELQAKAGKSYDKDTLNKLLKWGNCVTIAEAELSGNSFDLMLYLRDSEYENGVMVRGNEELIIEELKVSMKDSFDAYCEDVEMVDCAEENLGEVPMCGFDIKGNLQGTGKYIRILFIQNDDFFGCILINGASEEDLQAMTDLLVKIEE